MESDLCSSITRLSNADLLAGVKRLAARERQGTAVLIAHLGELDERRLYLAEGYSSLFTYCTQVLHLSEHAAYHRIEAARAARKFPVLLERLADGSVTLTTIRLLAPHLTPENHQDLLERARHQSRRAVEELVAQVRPLPPVPPSVRKLPARRHRAVPLAKARDAQVGSASQAEDANGEITAPHVLAPSLVTAAKAPATITPLSPQRYKIQFTASAETRERLLRAQALLRHQVPDGDIATIIDRALTALLEQIAKQKAAATDSDRPRWINRGAAAHRSRYIPNAVKREVWIRDGGRCAFVGKQGRRCSEEGFLEFHHLKPYAVGGEATTNNIQLRCRAHNTYEAELSFGPDALSGIREARDSYSVRTELVIFSERSCGRNRDG